MSLFNIFYKWVKQKKSEKILQEFDSSFSIKNSKKEVNYNLINNIDDPEMLDFLSEKISSYKCIWLQDIKNFKLEFIDRLYQKGFKLEAFPDSSFFFFETTDKNELEKIKLIIKYEGLEKILSRKDDYREKMTETFNDFLVSCYFYLNKSGYDCKLIGASEKLKKYNPEEIEKKLVALNTLFELGVQETKWYNHYKNKVIPESCKSIATNRPIFFTIYLFSIKNGVAKLYQDSMDCLNNIENNMLSNSLKKKMQGDTMKNKISKTIL